MNMKTHFLPILLLAGVLGTGLGAQELRVAIGEQPPLLSQAGGIVNLVIQEALKREGYTVKWDWLPIGRMLKSLEEDSLDLFVTPSNTPGQQHPHVDFLSARGVFFFLKSRMAGFKVTRLEDLAGKRVGTVTNSPLKAMFEKAGILVDEGPFETMFTKLETGRVDFTSTADVGGILTIRKAFPGREAEFDFTDFSYTEIRTGLYVRDLPAYKGILQAAARGFARMKADGTLDQLLKDFFGPGNARRVKVY